LAYPLAKRMLLAAILIVNIAADEQTEGMEVEYRWQWSFELAQLLKHAQWTGWLLP
jgi:hypothetical protein